LQQGANRAEQGGNGVRALLKLSSLIDTVNARLGQGISWLILVVVLVSATNATVRKVFDTSSNAWLELQWILFGVVFLLCSPWTLLCNEHIRIDIIYNMLPRRWRNIIDLAGHIVFLLPLTIVMIITSVPFFYRSIAINEQSTNAGGLAQWPAKSLVLIGFVLLFAQAGSELIKRVAVLRGIIPDPQAADQTSAEIEASHLVAAADTERT
jgi:TRAP-type mannitol/chloroaromatic compound transport system permease small subunit